MRTALTLALEHAATAHDTAYLALAQKLALPLVTAGEAPDLRLAGSGLHVRWLGDPLP